MSANFNPTGTLTGANSIITLSIANLYPAPFQLQQYAADDLTDVEAIDSAEVVMGVDGTLSAGFVYVPYKQSVALQANSPSIVYFDTLWATMQQQQDVYQISGTILLPSISMKYTLVNGYLTSYTAFPGVKKTLQPRKFTIAWNIIVPQATA